jgi:hypothetical protein
MHNHQFHRAIVLNTLRRTGCLPYLLPRSLRLPIFSPLGLNPEKDRDSSRAAATRARMTNQAKAGFFCHSRASALSGARGIPFLLSLLMKIHALLLRERPEREQAVTYSQPASRSDDPAIRRPGAEEIN